MSRDKIRKLKQDYTQDESHFERVISETLEHDHLRKYHDKRDIRDIIDEYLEKIRFFIHKT